MGARFSAPVQTGSEAHPAFSTMSTGSFPGVKRPGRGVDHPLPSSAEVEGRVEVYISSPSGPPWPVLGWNLVSIRTSSLNDQQEPQSFNESTTRNSAGYLLNVNHTFHRPAKLFNKQKNAFFWTIWPP